MFDATGGLILTSWSPRHHTSVQKATHSASWLLQAILVQTCLRKKQTRAHRLREHQTKFKLKNLSDCNWRIRGVRLQNDTWKFVTGFFSLISISFRRYFGINATQLGTAKSWFEIMAKKNDTKKLWQSEQKWPMFWVQQHNRKTDVEISAIWPAGENPPLNGIVLQI